MVNSCTEAELSVSVISTIQHVCQLHRCMFRMIINQWTLSDPDPLDLGRPRSKPFRLRPSQIQVRPLEQVSAGFRRFSVVKFQSSHPNPGSQPAAFYKYVYRIVLTRWQRVCGFSLICVSAASRIILMCVHKLDHSAVAMLQTSVQGHTVCFFQAI